MSSLEPQKRRRFSALKNLRRIFRRRTVASAETLPNKGKIRSHIAASGQNSAEEPTTTVYSVDTLTASYRHQTPLISNRSAHYQSSSGSGGFHDLEQHLSAGHRGTGSSGLRAGDFMTGERRRRHDHHQYRDSVTGRDSSLCDSARSSGGNETTVAAVRQTDINVHKRTYSEDRLKEG